MHNKYITKAQIYIRLYSNFLKSVILMNIETAIFPLQFVLKSNLKKMLVTVLGYPSVLRCGTCLEGLIIIYDTHLNRMVGVKGILI
jgi:hypothetical protein